MHARVTLSWVWVPGLILAVGAATVPSLASPLFWVGMGLAFMVVCTAGEGAPERKITVGQHCDPEGKPKFFTLTFGAETVRLDPGKTWIKVDAFKWVTRGLIEPPQSFHVQPNGNVDINGEKIRLEAPDGITKLEYEINKRHVVIPVPKTPVATPSSPLAHLPSKAPVSDKVIFKVKLDQFGHLMVECLRGTERVETSLRGFHTLIQNGLVLKPQSLHVDPLQRAIEIDGVRFECTPAGAQQLQETLNAQYAPPLKAEEENAIDIKENPASATGFDIRFVTVHLGARFEVKGHLSQEKLDILQDSVKCDLLQPGIVLRLSPPNLLIRRRRTDGGEERLAEFPDLQYRRATALQLQQIFNHPLIRKIVGEAGPVATHAVQEQPAGILQMRVIRNPQNKLLLWLECVTTKAGPPEGKALTHHNVADLQHRGVFLPHLDISLSFDNRTLGILNQQDRQEQTLTLDSQSSDEDLAKASRMLTEALIPPAPATIQPESGLSSARS